MPRHTHRSSVASLSGLPPGRTGIETKHSAQQWSDMRGQDYPPAGLGLRQITTDRRSGLLWSGLPPGRTGIETSFLHSCSVSLACQDYPPAGLGLRPFTWVLFKHFEQVRTTPRPDEMWAIDGTACMTDQGNATVFVVIDHCTGECLAARAAQRGTRHEAIDTIRQTICARTK